MSDFKTMDLEGKTFQGNSDDDFDIVGFTPPNQRIKRQRNDDEESFEPRKRRRFESPVNIVNIQDEGIPSISISPIIPTRKRKRGDDDEEEDEEESFEPRKRRRLESPVNVVNIQDDFDSEGIPSIYISPVIPTRKRKRGDEDEEEDEEESFEPRKRRKIEKSRKRVRFKDESGAQGVFEPRKRQKVDKFAEFEDSESIDFERADFKESSTSHLTTTMWHLYLTWKTINQKSTHNDNGIWKSSGAFLDYYTLPTVKLQPYDTDFVALLNDTTRLLMERYDSKKELIQEMNDDLLEESRREAYNEIRLNTLMNKLGDDEKTKINKIITNFVNKWKPFIEEYTHNKQKQNKMIALLTIHMNPFENVQQGGTYIKQFQINDSEKENLRELLKMIMPETQDLAIPLVQIYSKLSSIGFNLTIATTNLIKGWLGGSEYKSIVDPFISDKYRFWLAN